MQSAGTRMGDVARLALLSKMYELEIQKLELQLELVKLSQNGPPTNNATSINEAGKSMGNVKAPQKTLFPQPWP